MGRVYPRYQHPSKSHTERFLREDIEKWFSERDASLRRMDEKSLTEFWVGVNTSMSRAQFVSSGGFDPELRIIQEDSELAVRLYGQGTEFVYEPGAVVYDNETKDLLEQRVVYATHGGRADIYRVRSKGQADAPLLSAMMEGGLLQRLKHRMAWREPRIAQCLADLCRGVADLVGSRFFYARWASLTFAVGYWRGVKSQGVTLESLGELLSLLRQ